MNKGSSAAQRYDCNHPAHHSIRTRLTADVQENIWHADVSAFMYGYNQIGLIYWSKKCLKCRRQIVSACGRESDAKGELIRHLQLPACTTVGKLQEV
jgi:hypothetical protein